MPQRKLLFLLKFFESSATLERSMRREFENSEQRLLCGALHDREPDHVKLTRVFSPAALCQCHRVGALAI